MNEKLKPTPENINKDKLPQIEKNFSFDLISPDASPILNFINEYSIKVYEELENDLFGAITQTALGTGIKYEYAINKSFIVDAIKRAMASKPKNIITLSKPCACGCCDMDYSAGECPNCHEDVHEFETFCPDCGQKLKWSDEDE